MKIAVCVKQVPDTAGGVKFKPDGTLDRGAMMTIMNPDDKSALEVALRLKDEDPENVEVTALTMGLPKAEEVLREALAMGADKALLITDRRLGGADTWATSSTIAGALKNMEYDLVVAGRQAIDGDTAQVGPQIAEHLGIPCISYASDVSVKDGYVTAKREFDDGYHVLKAKLPALITVLGEKTAPRYMTPGGIFAAYDAQITTWGRDQLDVDDKDIGLKGSPTVIAKASDKVAKGKGTIVTPESAEEGAEDILKQLETKHII
jgi:electron transfer flavoprotein beta subunit